MYGDDPLKDPRTNLKTLKKMLFLPETYCNLSSSNTAMFLSALKKCEQQSQFIKIVFAFTCCGILFHPSELDTQASAKSGVRLESAK